jgi:hypothetical protein
MEQSIPPPLLKVNRQKRLIGKILFFSIWLGVFLWVLIPATIFVSTICQLFEASRINFTSYIDTFSVKILEVKSEPNYFEERIRVQCFRDMRDAGISVYDLNNAGIFKTNAPNGEIIYQWGHPEKVRQSTPVRANGKFSTCEMLFRVTTTSTNTIWHGEDAGGSIDTTLPNPMTVSEIKTNWSGSYQRNMAIPLASLGEYKILLSVK